MKSMGWSIIKTVFLSLPFGLISQHALAANFILFDFPGHQVERYDRIVEHLVPGDSIQFSNGKIFKIQNIIGHGNLTLVLGIGNERVLRIPLRSGFFEREIKTFSSDSQEILMAQKKISSRYTDFLKFYLEGHKSLRKSGIPIPTVYESVSLFGEYIVVEDIHVQFTLSELIKSKNRARLIKDKNLFYDALIEFAGKTWEFSNIYDFHSEQLGWNGQKWILFDFSNTIVRSWWSDHHTVFNSSNLARKSFSMLPQDVRIRMAAAIGERRREENWSFKVKNCILSLANILKVNPEVPH